MNVTEADIRRYLEVFYSTLFEEARSKLEPDTFTDLTHGNAVPSRITAYVSTKFGVALNYERLPNATSRTEVEIRTVRGSARAEDLLFETPAGLIPTPRNWALTINGGERAYMIDSKFTCVDTPIYVVKPHTVVTLVNFTHHRPAFGRYSARTRVIELAEIYGERSTGF